MRARGAIGCIDADISIGIPVATRGLARPPVLMRPRKYKAEPAMSAVGAASWCPAMARWMRNLKTTIEPTNAAIWIATRPGGMPRSASTASTATLNGMTQASRHRATAQPMSANSFLRRASKRARWRGAGAREVV